MLLRVIEVNHMADVGTHQSVSGLSAEACLKHWGPVTHLCVSKLTIIGSDNGLSPGRRQAIIWTNDGMLLIGPLRTNFNETSIEIHVFSFKKIYLKLSSAKRRPFCPGLNVLIQSNKRQATINQTPIFHQLKTKRPDRREAGWLQ